MADEQDKEKAGTPEDGAEETPEVTEADAPTGDAPQAEEAPAAEASAEEPAAEQAPAEQAPPEEGPAEDLAAAEGSEDADPQAAPEAPASAPADELTPKQRRRKARSTHSGEARPTRSPEERHAERVAERRRKAVRRRARRLQERAKAAARRAAAPPPEALAPVHAPVEGKRKVRQGVVVSDKAEKTITVRIDVARRHRRYEKIVRSSNTVHAHDENNDAHEGDVVRVIESRPLSRSKRWALVDVLERAR